MMVKLCLLITLTGLFVFILTVIGCVLKFEASFCS